MVSTRNILLVLGVGVLWTCCSVVAAAFEVEYAYGSVQNAPVGSRSWSFLQAGSAVHPGFIRLNTPDSVLLFRDFYGQSGRYAMYGQGLLSSSSDNTWTFYYGTLRVEGGQRLYLQRGPSILIEPDTVFGIHLDGSSLEILVSQGLVQLALSTGGQPVPVWAGMRFYADGRFHSLLPETNVAFYNRYQMHTPYVLSQQTPALEAGYATEEPTAEPLIEATVTIVSAGEEDTTEPTSEPALSEPEQENLMADVEEDLRFTYEGPQQLATNTQEVTILTPTLDAWIETERSIIEQSQASTVDAVTLDTLSAYLGDGLQRYLRAKDAVQVSNAIAAESGDTTVNATGGRQPSSNATEEALLAEMRQLLEQVAALEHEVGRLRETSTPTYIRE